MEDALAHVEDWVGLVICDLESTQIHGMELVRLWKARQPQTPFLALTAVGGRQLGDRSHEKWRGRLPGKADRPG